MKPLLILHNSWMRAYRGPVDDLPFGKFSDASAHEAFNFFPTDGVCYGYAPVAGINLGRLGASPEEDSLSDVLVVWTAPSPEERRRYVVGWYNGATVFREPQLRPNDKDVLEWFGQISYVAAAPADRCRLLPVEERQFEVPRMQKGYPGMSSSFYPVGTSPDEWVTSLRTYVEYQDWPARELAEPPDEPEAPEGALLTRVHGVRERSKKVVEAKKRAALKAGKGLLCEGCGFDFEAAYGPRGEGFIECHHTMPLSQYGPGQTTKPSDLALVCANCHRMIHVRVPWLSVEELRELVHAHDGW